MQRFKNILVVCDEDSNTGPALRRAANMALANNAAVTLLHVIDMAPGELNRLLAALPRARSVQVADQIRGYHGERLAELAKPLLKAGVATQTKVLEGTAFLEVIRHVLIEKHDLVIKGVHDGGGNTGLFAGGYDLHLLRKCPCPVWMIKDTDESAAGNILVAVDPDEEDQTRHALNTMVMEMATSLSEIDNAHLHILNVWRLQEEQALRSGRFTLSPAELESVLSHEKAVSKERFDKLLAAHPANDLPRTAKHIKGLAGEVIPAYASDHDIDTIVMGTVGRTGISGLFIGNTAEAILNTVKCTVLAVKPPGFRSPVAAAT